MQFDHHHHHSRFSVLLSMLARVGRFLPVCSFHNVLSCAHSALRPTERKSCLTHSSHVFLLLPLPFGPATTKFLQADTQSSLFFRSRCPNHRRRPHLTTSATRSTPKRLFKSSLDILFLRLTPHIHLTIIRSVLSRRCLSSDFTGQVLLP